MTKSKKTTEFGEALIEALEEVVAWKRGEIELEVVEYPDPMPVEEIKAIRKKVAKSAKDFERRFGIPASTLNNWEQGRRRPDPASRLLLRVIEAAPETVEKVAKDAA
ncbi:MAG: helix-turn-helix domain-containing protein [Devosia sp.]